MIWMLSISKEDIIPPDIFEKQRDEITRRIIEIKKMRRVETKTFSFLFESRETVLNQINEMVYIERVKDQDEIDFLLRVYSDLLPGPGLLSVSMFIEFRDEKQLVQEMKNLTGIEDTVYLTFDGSQLKATPEEGRSTETLESTLQYLKFSFTSEMARKFKAAGNVYIETRKPGYSESARIPAVLLDQLKLEI
jgi:hypothetical protein